MYEPEDVAQAEILGAASEQYDDWLGTVALDDPHDDSLYAVAGLDRDEWTIVGISLAAGRIGVGDVTSAASVYAVSRDLVTKFEDFADVARQYGGRIPVVQFGLDVEQAALRLLELVFKRWTINVVTGGIARDYDLAIMDVREVSDGGREH
jgi:hypothetical protein